MDRCHELGKKIALQDDDKGALDILPKCVGSFSNGQDEPLQYLVW